MQILYHAVTFKQGDDKVVDADLARRCVQKFVKLMHSINQQQSETSKKEVETVMDIVVNPFHHIHHM